MIFNKYRVALSIVLMIVLSDCKTNQKTIINSHQNSKKSLFSSTKKVTAVGYSAASSEAPRTGKIWINGYIENFDFEIIDQGFLFQSIAVDKAGNSYITGSQGRFHVGYWYNSKWIDLPHQGLDQNSYTVSIFVDENKNVFVGGGSMNNAGLRIPGYWKNGRFFALPALQKSQSCYVEDMLVADKSKIIASGVCLNSEQNKIPVIWENNKLFILPVKSMSLFSVGNIGVDLDGNIYVLGNLKNGEQTIVGYWKNKIWTGLSSRDTDDNFYVTDIDFDKAGVVYVSGTILNSDENEYIPVYWKNNKIVTLEMPNGTAYDGFTTDIQIDASDNIYISGYLLGNLLKGNEKTETGIWINRTWYNFPGGDPNFTNKVNSILIH